MGSGSNIKKSIKQFGLENFEKIVLFNFDNKKDMLEKEKELVNDEFIRRGDTYNIMLGGGFNTNNLVVVKDKYGNIQSVHKTDPRYLSGELFGINRGLINVKNKNNNIIKVSVNDDRFLSGDLVGVNKGLINVKDINNNIIQVSVNDPRYISGELKHYFYGRKHTYETKCKIGYKNSILQKGDKNSQFNTCWIYNLSIKESKKIKNDELEIWISNGWIKGRKIKF